MTTLSGSALPFVKGYDVYISLSAPHDLTRPGGPSARVEYQSCLGDCQPGTYVGDIMRTRLAFGKPDLEIDAYSYVLSHSHEELDPNNDFHGWIAHQLAREWAREAWPGRQVKIVTQRDNGRWEEDEHGERVWVEGKWHSHIVVANVAEQAVTLQWADADGIEKTKHYKPGRAIDGDLKNIFRLRRVTDAVVLREWRYDNQAYVEACRQFSEGAASKQDLAQRAERGYSTYDEVRLKLRTAAALATDWDDYTARCQAAAVDVATRGAGGVSYSWVDDAGLERKARAKGKNGIGPEFTKGEIEKQCEQNAEVLARGGQLEVPEQALVVPTSTVAPDRPRPQYQTPDGKPPWEAADALAAYEARVRSTGGTYEGRVARALVTGEPVEGVTLEHRSDTEVVATVDAGDGPLRGDVDPVLAQRVAEVRRAETKLDADQEQLRQGQQQVTEGAQQVIAEHEAVTAARAAWEEVEKPALEKEVTAEATKVALADWEQNEKPKLIAAAKAEGTKEADEALLDTVVALDVQVDEIIGKPADPAAVRAKYERRPLKPGEGPRLVKSRASLIKHKVETMGEAAQGDRDAAAEALRQAEADSQAVTRRLAEITERDEIRNKALVALRMPDMDPTTGQYRRDDAGKIAWAPVAEVVAAHEEHLARAQANMQHMADADAPDAPDTGPGDLGE